jgi:hypothetical protein
MSNSPDNNRRCKRTASKIAIVKDVIDKQWKFWICDDCFNEKIYNNKLFKDHLIQVTELRINKKWVLLLLIIITKISIQGLVFMVMVLNLLEFFSKRILGSLYKKETYFP